MEQEILTFTILACLIFYFTFRKAETGLYLLVAAIPLSFWEVPINFLPYIMKSWYGGPVRSSLTINLADMVILALSLKTITGIKINEALKLLRLPLSAALILVLFTAYLSVGAAAYRNLLSGDFLRTSVTYLAKFTEVILVYFIVIFNLKTLSEVKRLTMMLVLVGVLSTIAANVFPWMKWIGKGFFDTRLIPGGFYCILSGICFSLMLNERLKPSIRILMEIFLIILVFSIIMCFKRTTYLGLSAVIAALFIMRPEKRAVVALLAFFVLTLILAEPARFRVAKLWDFYSITAKERSEQQSAISRTEFEKIVRQNTPGDLRGVIKEIKGIDTEKEVELIEHAVKGQSQEKIAGIISNLDPALLSRIYSGKGSLRSFKLYPIFGIGFWGTLGRGYLAHNAYLRIISETGLIGFTAFIFMVAAIAKNGISLHMQKKDKFISDFSCGFLAGFTGIMAMGIFSEIFIVFTLMQIVYFMAGMLAISGILLKEKDEKSYR